MPVISKFLTFVQFLLDMSLDDVPQSYSEALDEGYRTFEVEYSGRGGWGEVSGLFEDALQDEAEILEGLSQDPDILVNTGELLLGRMDESVEGYLAVLYKRVEDTREPVAKTYLELEEGVESDTQFEVGIPEDTGEVVVDGNNLRDWISHQ